MTAAERKAQEQARRVESPAESGTGRWFLVANGSRAQAWQQRVGSPGYDLVREWDDPEARFNGTTDLRPHDPKADEATAHTPRDLMEELVADLSQAVRTGSLRGFYLLAPAPFLSRLKSALPNDIRHYLVAEHGGDLVQMPRGELFQRLDALRRATPEGVPADAPAALRHPSPDRA